MDYPDPDRFTYSLRLTKPISRSACPYLESKRSELSTQGKMVLVTGVAGGVGKFV